MLINTILFHYLSMKINRSLGELHDNAISNRPNRHNKRDSLTLYLAG